MIKILYAGSPEESGVTLEGLISLSGTDFEIAGVLTNPASAKKRSSTLIPTPVDYVLNPIYLLSIIQTFKSLTYPSAQDKFNKSSTTSSIGVSTGIS